MLDCPAKNISFPKSISSAHFQEAVLEGTNGVLTFFLFHVNIFFHSSKQIYKNITVKILIFMELIMLV